MILKKVSRRRIRSKAGSHKKQEYIEESAKVDMDRESSLKFDP